MRYDPAERRCSTVIALVLVAVVCGFACPAALSPASRPMRTRTVAVAPRGSNVVAVIATDFALRLPDSIRAGLTTFRLVNHGKQGHQMTVVRLDSGKTPAQALAALIAAGRGRRPAWMHPVGGPNAIAAGGKGNATLVLAPGTYLAYCEVPGPEPMPHFMKGMAAGFTVTPPAHPAALPKGDLTITLTDYAFTLSHPLTSGHHVIVVTNASAQAHMLVMNDNPPNQGLKEFVAWAFNPQGKPAPGRAVGGATEMAPGDTVVIEGDFPPGHYGLICFSPDAVDGKPHFMHGMEKEFTVR